MEFKEFLKDFDNLKPKQIGEVYKGTNFTIEYMRDIKEIPHYNIEIYLTKNIIYLEKHPEHIIKTLDLDTELLIEQADNALERFLTREYERGPENVYDDNATCHKYDFSLLYSMNKQSQHIYIEDNNNTYCRRISHKFKIRKIKINGIIFSKSTYKQWEILHRENIIFITDGNRYYISFPFTKFNVKNVKENGDFDLFVNGIKKGSHNIFKEEDLFYLNMRYGI